MDIAVRVSGGDAEEFVEAWAPDVEVDEGALVVGADYQRASCGG